jgi:hypothetical protein
LAEPASGEPFELIFDEGVLLADSAEVALEDYARALTASAGAVAVKSGESEDEVIGVRLLGPAVGATPEARRDIQDFARGLATQGGGLGLGWA